MRKFILRYFASFLLLIICVVSNKSAYSQTVTLGSISGGLSSSTINSGQTQRALYGISVQVAGGSVTFNQFNLTCSANTNSVMANGTLYRSTGGSTYSAGSVVAVGHVIFNNTNITMSGFTETITNSTNYYFLVVDAINTSNFYSVQVINTYGANLATDVNGVNYPLNAYSARSYDFRIPGTAYPVTITSTNYTASGLTSNTSSLTAGLTDLKLFTFGITTTSNSTFSALRINSNVANIGNYFSNFKLYSNTSNTFTGATQVTGLTAGTSGSYVTFTTAGSTISASTTIKYYFLVADCSVTGTLPVNVQFSFTSGQSSNALTRATPSVASYNTFTSFGQTYNVNTASVTLTSQQNGISNGTLTTGQTDIVLFGFGASATSGISISEFNINSSGALASAYFGNARLYRSTTNNYATGSKTLVGTATFDNAYCNITFSTAETLNTTEKYYFLVADNIGGVNGSPTTTFKFMSGQSTDAVVQTNPVSSYNTFDITGNAFTIPGPTVIYGENTTGYTRPSTIYAGQSGVIAAFDLKAFGNITVTGPYIDLALSQTNPIALFPASGIQVWLSTTGSFADATQVTGVTAGNAGSGIRLTFPSTLNFTSGTTYSYYIVGTLAASATLPVNCTIGSAGVLSINGGNSYATSTLARPSYELVTAKVIIEGNNSAAAGITQGALSYGQTNIVLFSYKLTGQGTLTISEMSVPSSVDMGNYFNNGKVYRSSTPYFANATQIAGATVTFGSAVNMSSLGQVFTANSPTTYYYFIVADLLASTNINETTVTYNFSPAQTVRAINNSNYAGYAFNGFTTTDGANHYIALIYKWKGGTSSDFSNLANFRTIKDGIVGSLGTNSIIEIGVESYTNAPTITTATTIGGIMFGNAVTNPTLSIQANRTLTINKSITVANGSNATITGPPPATVNITSGSSSSISNTLTAGSALTLAGGLTVSNAGTFNVANLSAINFSGGSIFNNTGTLNLRSGPSGSASIGALADAAGTTTGTVTGTVNVERYITGGSSTYRGYRLLSSPVHSGSTAFYDLSYLKGSGTYLTGTGGTANGWDVAGNPTLYLFRPDITPTSSSFTNGNYRPVTKINNTPNAYLTGTPDGNFNLGIGNGYLMFYRGNNGTLTTTIPNSLVLSASGTLNQGNVQVKPWFTGAATLDYTATALNTNSSVRGFNLVGNPYASTIDWNTNGTSSTNGIYRTDVGTTIYVLDPVTQGYSTYNSSNGSYTLNGSRYIPSGQGFFVLATSALAQLTFRETAKVSNQVSGNSLLLNAAINKEPDRHIRMRLYKADNIYDDIYLGFKQSASTTYVFNEDSPYKQGNGKVSFTSLSSDNEPMAINYLPLPEKQQMIPLNIRVNGAGLYQLNTTEILNVPELLDVWLYDNLTKDSLDIRHNKIYSFKTTADTASYGANRFKLVIRANAAKSVRLLNFSAVKSSSKVDISWTSENEADHTLYRLERSVDGGKTFIVIDSVTSAKLGTYNDIDAYPAKGLNHYRLKQTDVLGKSTYSAIIPVMYTEPAEAKLAYNIINVYPNPVSQTLNLAIAKADKTVVSGSYKITIVNSLGHIVQTTNTKTPNWQGNVGQLLPGTYFVQVLNTLDNTVTGKSTFIKL